jgi:UDP-N-acetylglucosamine 2-epimerase (non-hydrolysing)
MKVLHVVGARPNFMKIAPVMKALAERGVEQELLHTGQHYDPSMSDVFFADLGLPRPDLSLGVGSGTHAEQTARVMLGFEAVVRDRKPDRIVVVGDVNSTLACALVAAKLHVPCAHIEAGLRSFDMRMPEEINRVLTDRICDLLLTPSEDADQNLLREGTEPERIRLVGNVLIDALHSHLDRARAREPWAAHGQTPGSYAVLTLHRPSNVDDPAVLSRLLSALEEVQRHLPVLFPAHPRTRKALDALGGPPRGLVLLPPLGYLDFLGLTAEARMVLTDSGGLQEETTILGVPCLTLRENTERPITVTHGTNVLVGTDPERIVAEARAVLEGRVKEPRIPRYWDGRAGERIADALA